VGASIWEPVVGAVSGRARSQRGCRQCGRSTTAGHISNGGGVAIYKPSEISEAVVIVLFSYSAFLII
jgi:hypothetical protein